MGSQRAFFSCFLAAAIACSSTEGDPPSEPAATAGEQEAADEGDGEEKEVDPNFGAKTVVPDWAKEHWAWAPLKRPEVPKCQGKWCNGEIDAFVQAALTGAKVEPAEDADKATLVRRLYLDLTGLPPTPEDVKQWSKKDVPALVDHLLASPAYAEHMANWWLDQVRFADTVGYFGDQQQHVWPYRDWVIAAFMEGMPFDRFTQAQLAGDLLPDPSDADIVATTYNRLLPTSSENGVQAKEYLALYAADRVANVSSVWLGSTIECARCHDHPHDPFSQRDFYSLAAFFADITESGTWKKSPNKSPTKRPPEEVFPSPLDTAMGKSPREGKTMITKARKKPRTTRILARGNWMDDSGPIVKPNVPELVGWLGVKHPKGKRRANRLHLAKWLTAPKNPLTSRVIVNRLWARLFGHGMSKWMDDFGIQGEKPVDAALLDWLAVEFVESGWDIRHVIKLLATSHAYRQSSKPRPDLPPGAGQFFARQHRFQLDGEVIRDQALFVSGLLNDKLGGPSVYPYQPEGVWANLNLPARTYKRSKGADLYRRSVYTFWQRQFPHPMLTAFGSPARLTCTVERPREYTAAQALALLDDPQFVEAARVFAVRILNEGGKNDDKRVNWAWQAATLRAASAEERAALVALLEQSRTEFSADEAAAKKLAAAGDSPTDKNHPAVEIAAWTQVARAVFNAAVTSTRT